MVNLNINPNSINPGGTEESLAASSAMITTGMEKSLNKNRSSLELKEEKVDFGQMQEYIQKLTDSTKVERIAKRREKKEGEPEEDVLQKEKRRLEQEKRRERPRAFKWIRPKNLKNVNTVKAGTLDKFSRIKDVDQNLIKEYAVKYARKITGFPKESQDSVRLRFNEIEKELKLLGATEESLNTLKSKIEEALLRELAILVKKALINNLTSLDNLKKVILGAKNEKLFNFAFFNKIVAILNYDKEFTFAQERSGFGDAELIQSLLKELKLDSFKTNELVDEAEKLDVDLKSWLNMWNFDKIQINQEKEIIIDLSEVEKEKEKGLLLDELRMLEMHILLEKSWKNKFFISLRIKRVINDLYDYEDAEKEITNAKFQGRRLAWAKTISTLKELHLKRVFSESSKDFDHYSSLISNYTLKARKIGKDVSHEGVKWIETELKSLALNSAIYKLKLLKSMQELSFDKKRENTIKWLQKTTKHLKERIHQEEVTSHPFDLILNIFGLKA